VVPRPVEQEILRQSLQIGVSSPTFRDMTLASLVSRISARRAASVD
jgi:hypothetical protein